MKKAYSTIVMLAMMVAALSLTACGGSDSDDEDGTEELIEKMSQSNGYGTWKMVDYEVLIQNEALSDLFSFNVYSTVYVQIRENGTYTHVGLYESEANISSGTWKRNGNYITAQEKEGNHVGATNTYTIIELTTKKSKIIGPLGLFSCSFIKVPDSEIEKYL